MTKRHIHKPWVKLHIRTLHNHEVARLPDSSYRRFMECIMFAGEERNKTVEEGREDAEGFLPDIDYMSWTLHVDGDSLRDDLSRLALSGLVELRPHSSGADRWYVVSFAKWQEPATDAERKRQERERSKEIRNKNKDIEEYYDTKVSQNVTPNARNVTKRKQAVTPLEQLVDHFTSKTTFEGNQNEPDYPAKWQRPLEAILAQAGDDVEAAKTLINESLEVAWGNNPQGKTYTVSDPYSLRKIAVNRVNGKRATATAGDDDAVWGKALECIKRGSVPGDDPRLSKAIKAVGWQTLAGATEYNQSEIKGRLIREYRNAATA
jgi:hypothetical protein